MLVILLMFATAGVAQAQSISAVRTINFSGYEWIVKSSDTITGPITFENDQAKRKMVQCRDQSNQIAGIRRILFLCGKQD